MEAKKHPFDYDIFTRGDTISPEEIEEATGTKRGTDEFSIAAMSIASEVKDNFKLRGQIVSTPIKHHCIHILEHQPQSEYTHKAMIRDFRRAGRRFQEMKGVDVSKLSDEARKRHLKNLLVWDWKLSQMRKRLPQNGDTPKLENGDSNEE